MPIYRGRRRGTWRVTVYHEGRQREWTIEGTRRDAEAWEARQRAELRGGVADLRTVPTLSDYCVAVYAPHAEMHLKPNTWRERENRLALLLTHLGHYRMDRITPAVVEDYQRERLQAPGRKARTVSPVTVNNEVRLLGIVLRHAIDRGLPLPKPRFRMLRQPHPEAKAWSEPEVARLLRTLEEHSPSLYDLCRCLYLTGMRVGEAMALPMRHVDLDRGVIRIWPHGDWSPKSKHGVREIPMPDPMRPYFEAQAGEWAFPSLRPGREGTQRVSWSSHQWYRAVALAGLEGGVHRLRHSYATHFLSRRPDIHLLAGLMGHSTTTVTELYGWMLPDRIESARDVVPDPLS